MGTGSAFGNARIGSPDMAADQRPGCGTSRAFA